MLPAGVRYQLPLPGLAAERAQLFVAAALSIAPAEPPTPRELEVAYLVVAEGLTQREVTQRLGIAGKTVEAHWRNFTAKAECGGRELRRRLLAAYWWQIGRASAPLDAPYGRGGEA